ncbi:MAG TPA: MerR family transcriptional regulator [Paracoccaceae bacterium]|nr:MerR family transcriptional regulator [Paracoccaceae bacterium]
MNKSPDAFRTISEVAEQLDVPAHVLRFWETRFSQVKPVKRGGGRRYYRPDDVRLLRGIRGLLYDDGMTIKGVQKILREQGVRHVIGLGTVDGAEAPMPPVRRVRPAAMLAAAGGPAAVMARMASEPEDGTGQRRNAAGSPLPRAKPDEVIPGTGHDEARQRSEEKREHAETAAAAEPPANEGRHAEPVTARPGDRAALRRLVAELEALRRVMAEKPGA